MAADPTTPRLASDWFNDLARQGKKDLTGTVRMSMANLLQTGLLAFQEEPTREEREMFLVSPEAEMQAVQMMQSPDAVTRDQGLELYRDILEVRGVRS